MLKSQNPFHWPRMMPNFFSDQRDIETLTKGIRAVNYLIIIIFKRIFYSTVNNTNRFYSA